MVLAFASLLLFLCGFLGVRDALVAAYDTAQIEDTSGALEESAERPVSVPVEAGGDVGAEASAIAPGITEEP